MLRGLPEVTHDGGSKVSFVMVCGQPTYVDKKQAAMTDEGFVVMDTKDCANGFGERNHLKMGIQQAVAGTCEISVLYVMSCVDDHMFDVEREAQGEYHHGQIGACRIVVEEAEAAFFDGELRALFQQLSLLNCDSIKQFMEAGEDVPAWYTKLDVRAFINLSAIQSDLAFNDIPIV
ncbi:hypothetical protein DYB37_012941 [Aphanomyces astaci]|uniref:Uncharacterized protein n=1 Tax=Aphanomyces astaci TaxID=112090 RepID=A0A3R7BP64_APHAT|nr:hypothetical protein DYB35_006412 [Aphanomyces astaci]RHZ31120.1 hypothetical protein DYB37_012941 [Aphanomyces astaci]